MAVNSGADGILDAFEQLCRLGRSAMATLKVPVTPNDYIRGPMDAPVTLVEYGDYQCPYCGAAHPIVQAIESHFADQLRLVFRNFPLTEIHPLAEPAAETAEYAGANGQFWEMHDALYENQDQLGIPLFFALAQALGLSQEGLRDALENGTFAPKIQNDFLGGVRSGVNGTPTFFINGQRHDGTYDYPHLAAAIESQLVHARAPH
jgi:protein-disulfide isomerase